MIPRGDLAIVPTTIMITPTTVHMDLGVTTATTPAPKTAGEISILVATTTMARMASIVVSIHFCRNSGQVSQKIVGISVCALTVRPLGPLSPVLSYSWDSREMIVVYFTALAIVYWLPRATAAIDMCREISIATMFSKLSPPCARVYSR